MNFVQQAIEQTAIVAAQEVENQLDEQLHALNHLNRDDLETIRQRRLQQLKQLSQKKQEWLKRGHGEYRELAGEKEFFNEIKGEERLVCHFYRQNWPCKVMDKHLQQLAATHLETKFIKIDAEKAPFLVERLKIWMLPTLALVKLEKTVDYVVGFDELGGRDDFPTKVLKERLERAGIIKDVTPNVPSARQRKNIRHDCYSRNDSDEDSDF